MAHFEIRNLTFAYPSSPGKKVLTDINMKIEKGEYITVCGKSGSGKTTLLRHMKTVLTPNGVRSGDVLYCGKPLSDFSQREQSSQIGFVMQDPESQTVTDKVWHELAFGLESLGCDQDVMRTRVAEMASYFGIQNWFHRDVSELSGGEKQLLNLASVMAMQPEVLILDEPTSQLDPVAASDFLNTVRKINLEIGTTVIITEHRLEDILHSSDKIAVMEGGKLTAYEEPRDIGRKLKDMNSDMFESMPAPVRIYYGTGSTLKCPLTVREGRTWLSEYMEGKTVSVRAVKDRPKTERADDPAVEMREVWFRYSRELPDILRGFSLKVPKGAIFAIVGGNGTGKSTALKAMCGVCRPYRGKVLINGRNLEKYRTDELFRNNLAMLPQDPKNLFVKGKVQDELYEMCPDNKERVKEVSTLCEIEDLLQSHPYDISGGEQQRVAIAKVLLTDPHIILLDEPTKGMDGIFKIHFAKMLRQLSDRGITVIIVSHDIEFCAKYSDLTGMFFDGNVISSNEPRRFFSQNSFYTTAANRMSRHVFDNAVTDEDVIELCRKNS
jgi:energy-coupling factor transporter ATP-binding protein EcfA2